MGSHILGPTQIRLYSHRRWLDVLNFGFKKKKCTKNKDADQFCGYHEADLRHCFRICRLFVFSQGGSFIVVMMVCLVLYFQTLDLIEGLCDGYSFQYLRLDGQTPVSKRQELVQRFNNKHLNDC